MSNIRYSKKLSSTGNINYYKPPSKMTFKSSKQSFDDYGLNDNNHISGIQSGSQQNPDPRGNIPISNIRQPGSPIQLSNLGGNNPREIIKKGYCDNHSRTLKDLNNQLQLVQKINNVNAIEEINNQIINEKQEQEDCINHFSEDFNNLNGHVSRLPFSNIMPSNFPIKKSDIFPNSFSSCRNAGMTDPSKQHISDGYSSATKPIELEKSDTKPTDK